jgi:hypothetical protein
MKLGIQSAVWSSTKKVWIDPKCHVIKTRGAEDTLGGLTIEEAAHLPRIVEELSRPKARDPKLAAVRYFLTEHRTEGRIMARARLHHFQSILRYGVLRRVRARETAARWARERLRQHGKERSIPW